tara:strand:- start:5165 stop:6406 length:1242 start_codon:yes stop_codon:yes gene_type:complete
MNKKDRIVIDLDRLIESYETDLVDKLRHFGLETDIYETWVPDSDPVKSILNLVDSAWEANSDVALEIRASSTVLNPTAVSLLGKSLGDTMEVISSSEVNYVTILVSGLSALRLDSLPTSNKNTDNELEQFQTVEQSSTWQREAIDSSVNLSDDEFVSPNTSIYDLPQPQSIDHNTSFEDSDDLITIEGSHHGLTLRLQVEPMSHRIKKSTFTRDVNPKFIPLLEKFCTLIEGVPIQDASDHGVGRLEFSVRGMTGSRPVPGIVIAGAIDERLSAIQLLIRNTLANYRQKVGYSLTENTFYPEPSENWLCLSQVEKKEKLLTVLKHELEKIHVLPTEIDVLEIEYNVRVLVRFSGYLAEPQTDKQPIVMQLERAITEQIDPRLELYLELVQDQSKLRRLTSDPNNKSLSKKENI